MKENSLVSDRGPTFLSIVKLMPERASFVLCQIPHYAELSSCQMPGVWPERIVKLGIDW